MHLQGGVAKDGARQCRNWREQGAPGRVLAARRTLWKYHSAFPRPGEKRPATRAGL